jgi:hypothetical protein
MARQAGAPQWAPRLSPQKIRRLYETDAKGIYDTDLIDEVGFSLLCRCESLLDSLEARAGRPKCLACGRSIGRRFGGTSSKEARSERLRCPECGWEMTWGTYYGRLTRARLTGCDEEGVYGEFMARFRRARSPRKKMLAIDSLIHAFHHTIAHGCGAPSAVNLVEGERAEVVAILDRLAYGSASTPGTGEKARWWREHVKRT